MCRPFVCARLLLLAAPMTLMLLTIAGCGSADQIRPPLEISVDRQATSVTIPEAPAVCDRAAPLKPLGKDDDLREAHATRTIEARERDLRIDACLEERQALPGLYDGGGQ